MMSWGKAGRGGLGQHKMTRDWANQGSTGRAGTSGMGAAHNEAGQGGAGRDGAGRGGAAHDEWGRAGRGGVERAGTGRAGQASMHTLTYSTAWWIGGTKNLYDGRAHDIISMSSQDDREHAHTSPSFELCKDFQQVQCNV